MERTSDATQRGEAINMARNMTDRDPFRHLEYVQGESGAYNPHKADAIREEVARRAEENDGEWW